MIEEGASNISLPREMIEDQFWKDYAAFNERKIAEFENSLNWLEKLAIKYL